MQRVLLIHEAEVDLSVMTMTTEAGGEEEEGEEEAVAAAAVVTTTATATVVAITAARKSRRRLRLVRTALAHGRVPDRKRDRGRDRLPRGDPVNTTTGTAAVAVEVAVAGITRAAAVVANDQEGQDRALGRILLRTRRPRTRTRIATASEGSIAAAVVGVARRIARTERRTRRYLF
jgi:hypothetical protein